MDMTEIVLYEDLHLAEFASLTDLARSERAELQKQERIRQRKEQINYAMNVVAAPIRAIANYGKHPERLEETAAAAR